MSYQALTTENPNMTRVSHFPAKVQKLKSGHDEQRAAELEQYIIEAEFGLRSILKAGFFLECLAADLKHGQLGPWIEAHCKNRTWRTIQRWKEIAGGLGDSIGISLKKRLDFKLHEVLALPLNQVPEAMKAVREKLDVEIAGKSYRQLFLELKQVDEEDPTKPKRGRVKGSSGNTKEMRERAAQRAEEERIANLEDEAKDNAKWLLEFSDAKHAGAINEKIFLKVMEAAETFLAYGNQLKASRKS